MAKTLDFTFSRPEDTLELIIPPTRLFGGSSECWTNCKIGFKGTLGIHQVFKYKFEFPVILDFHNLNRNIHLKMKLRVIHLNPECSFSGGEEEGREFCDLALADTTA